MSIFYGSRWACSYSPWRYYTDTISDTLCSLAKCDLTLAHLAYLLLLGGYTFLVATFAVCVYLVSSTVRGGLRQQQRACYSKWLAILQESMQSNPFSRIYFLVYLATLTIAPAFLSAAVYLCHARVVVVNGEKKSQFRPRTYAIMFCGYDFLAC